MKAGSGLTAEEERKKWVAIVSGAVTFLLGGSYVLLNVFMDSNDWSGFQGEKTLSAEARKTTCPSSSHPFTYLFTYLLTIHIYISICSFFF